YRVYHEKGGYKRSRDRCTQLGGRLAIVPDEPTHVFVRKLAEGLPLWLGATAEKQEGVWLWSDGTKMTFKAWDRGRPNGRRPKDSFLGINQSCLWHDFMETDPVNLGFICEWKDK